MGLNVCDFEAFVFLFEFVCACRCFSVFAFSGEFVGKKRVRLHICEVLPPRRSDRGRTASENVTIKSAGRSLQLSIAKDAVGTSRVEKFVNVVGPEGTGRWHDWQEVSCAPLNSILYSRGGSRGRDPARSKALPRRVRSPG